MGAVRLGVGNALGDQGSVTILNPRQPGEKVVLHCLRGNQRLEIEDADEAAPANDQIMAD